MSIRILKRHPRAVLESNRSECLFGALYLSGRLERINESVCSHDGGESPCRLMLYFRESALRATEAAVACRVDKVQQPERDTILLSMRGPNGGGKLLLTASPNHPRIQLTSLIFENPAQPPMFCMLLRKHLTAGGWDPAGGWSAAAAAGGADVRLHRRNGHALSEKADSGDHGSQLEPHLNRRGRTDFRLPAKGRF